MKTYHEMIQFIVDQFEDSPLRHHEWAAVLAVAEAYGVLDKTVFNDVKFEKEFREQARKAQRKAASRASNEERRLANIARQGA